MDCIISAWGLHEAELRGFLTKKLNNSIIAEDILQDTFMRAMEQGTKFCHINNPRAWLFRVAKNLLIDSTRLVKKQKQSLTKNDDYLENIEEHYPQINVIETLDVCLPRAILELTIEDQQAIKACDLEGLTQAEYANKAGFSLVAAKSRVQRARKRLKLSLTQLCQINFDASGNICCLDPEGKSSCQI